MKLINKRRDFLLGLLATPLLQSCTSVPKNTSAITDFELQRYLGTWYEIARLDHSFERGLDNVTAEYSTRDDGGVTVKNRGRMAETGEWNEAIGKAYFVKDPNTAHLKVSFFGPFYGSYAILELDKVNYQYALVAGPNRNCLWILARTPSLEASIYESLVQSAREQDFPVDELILVSHTT